MVAAIGELGDAMRAAFRSDEYRSKKIQLLRGFKERQESALEALQTLARQHHVAVVETDEGLTLTPIREGHALEPPKFRELPESEQDALRDELARIGKELDELFGKFVAWAH
jgi:hypothetical protein